MENGLESRSLPPIARGQRHKKYLMYGAFGVLLIIILSAWLVTTYHQRKALATPAEIRRLATDRGITPYYPGPTPQNVAVVPNESRADKDVLTYVLTYQGKRIVVTAQAKPKGVSFDDFYTRILQHKADVFNRYGRAVIGTASGKTIASLVTNDTWVLLNTSEDMDSTVMTQIVTNLRPVH
jgi:hypothetical protein